MDVQGTQDDRREVDTLAAPDDLDLLQVGAQQYRKELAADRGEVMAPPRAAAGTILGRSV